MAVCPKACPGSRCLHFGVRSYLHHFYEECLDPEGQGSIQSRWSGLQRSSAVWKVSLALGLLILTAGVTTLSVGYSTPHKIESFGEGDLFFVDSQAINFNKGLHLSTLGGIGLSCLGCALTAWGCLFWFWPKCNLREKLFTDQGKRNHLGVQEGWIEDPGDVVTKSPVLRRGKCLSLCQR
uniref:Neurensin-1-like n=1 Tax=Gouania willdenowi TaxID=441366 RepID=A0A8C5G9T9_GOUWI